MHGIDSDPDVLARLQAMPGDELVTCHLGDRREMRVDVTPDLVVAMFGTLFALPTQADHVRCVASAARILAPAGRLIVEALVPARRRSRSSAPWCQRGWTPFDTELPVTSPSTPRTPVPAPDGTGRAERRPFGIGDRAAVAAPSSDRRE